MPALRGTLSGAMAGQTESRPVRFPPRPGEGNVRGRLRQADPGAPARGAAILCHPHPAMGGSMDVWLLPALAEALAADGWHALRFDFRSVTEGVRGGAHERERADLAGAISFIESLGLWASGRRLALVGWSFGALVALLHGLDEPAVTDWVGIAPPTVPVPDLPMAAIPEQRVSAWPARRIVIAGAHDQFFPPQRCAALMPHQLHVLADCDHFFFDRDPELSALVTASLR